FINKAPPTEPGIPQANSKPLKFFSKAACDALTIKAPLSAVNLSFVISILFNFPKYITIPRIPPSLIIKLDPFPSNMKGIDRSEEHTSELQSRFDLVCRLL